MKKPKPPVRPKLPRHEFIEEISAALVPISAALKQIERLERYNDELLRQAYAMTVRIDKLEHPPGAQASPPAARFTVFDQVRGRDLEAK